MDRKRLRFGLFPVATGDAILTGPQLAISVDLVPQAVTSCVRMSKLAAYSTANRERLSGV